MSNSGIAAAADDDAALADVLTGGGGVLAASSGTHSHSNANGKNTANGCIQSQRRPTAQLSVARGGVGSLGRLWRRRRRFDDFHAARLYNFHMRVVVIVHEQ
jgi:hypothetical protein